MSSAPNASSTRCGGCTTAVEREAAAEPRVAIAQDIGSASIETTGVGYTLLAAPELVDLRRFDNLARMGRQHAADGDDDAATSAFAAAAALWRGSPLIELADWSPALGERSRLEEQYRTVLEDWAEAAVACGQHHEWIAPLEQMVFDEPLREQRWALLMRALSRCGRQADALRAFQRARMALRDVGLDPGRTARLLLRTLAQNDELLTELGYWRGWVTPHWNEPGKFHVEFMGPQGQVLVALVPAVGTPEAQADEMAHLLLSTEPDHWNIEIRHAWPAGQVSEAIAARRLLATTRLDPAGVVDSG